MASNAPLQRKRCWGKSTHKEKINIIENMELEVPDRVVFSGFSTDATVTDGEKPIDLQHPELLSNEKLVKLLTERRVPIPVYGNGSASRERLLFLFRKHVVPRPQRKRRQKNAYKDGIYHNGEVGVVESNQPMEWDKTNESRLWDGGGNESVLGKRKTEHDEPPLMKKSNTPIQPETTPIGHMTTIPSSISDPHNSVVVRKLKRPRVSGVKIESKIRNTDDSN